MTKITISYRREDSGVIAGRIFDRLVAHYGADSVFRDIDNIPPGIDYRKYINAALENTDILLAIVGPLWAGKTPDGRVRIREPTDLVRIEVEAVLRKDIPVIPVLVGNATMPSPDELPDGLRDFPFRNAVKVDALEDFDDHVKRLIRSLDRLLQSNPATAEPSTDAQLATKRDHATNTTTEEAVPPLIGQMIRSKPVSGDASTPQTGRSTPRASVATSATADPTPAAGPKVGKSTTFDKAQKVSAAIGLVIVGFFAFAAVVAFLTHALR